jgi:hypothetical protein
MKKEISTNYKIKNLTSTTNIARSGKVTVFLLISCLTVLYNTFLPALFGGILFDHLFI